jgi:hypothetical protein
MISAIMMTENIAATIAPTSALEAGDCGTSSDVPIGVVCAVDLLSVSVMYEVVEGITASLNSAPTALDVSVLVPVLVVLGALALESRTVDD